MSVDVRCHQLRRLDPARWHFRTGMSADAVPGPDCWWLLGRHSPAQTGPMDGHVIEGTTAGATSRRLATAVVISRIRWVFIPLALVGVPTNVPPPVNLGLFLAAIAV